MIGKLTGTVDAIGNGELVLDVNGVGYLVQAGARTLRGLAPGQATELHVETYVRQDVFKLFGFSSEGERAWFVRLQDVQGVGAKSALAVLDVLAPDELMQAALMEDKAAVARAVGVGPKVAARIVAELKDKPAPVGRGGAFAVQASASQPAQSGAAFAPDAVSALINLGFAGPDASAAVRTASSNAGTDAGLDELIRLALKELNR
ncbi:Holliday junction ATP-dependent DNA helicase RuvA [hydrothermal vent metagenome]|uniref:Holliday junction ATP-dependent DNA helicase RuvA n=1 Tax=hydrothermal vent metagenome TaxID=652676 RepID=A0A3B0RH40_9ZZZZ